MPEFALDDLVNNRTMSPAMAATLATAVAERRSMLFVAIPRMAGKSTNMHATLKAASAGTPLHMLSRALPGLGIPKHGDGGYLVVSEISEAGFEDYLWGRDVRSVFAALREGFSLTAALHASGPDEAFAVITGANGVPDADAAHIDLLTYIRSIGPWSRPQRRVIAAIYEIEGVHAGRPEARLLHRWSEDDDHFEVVDSPLKIGVASSNPAP